MLIINGEEEASKKCGGISSILSLLHNFAKDMIHHTEQKVDETSTTNNYCKEVVLFNSDTLVKIISYLPSVDVLNLALTCKRFGISDDDKLSVIKMSTDIIVHDIATEEQLAALPHYDGESSLADYHYLQLLRAPLTFDQLVGSVEYVNSGDKSCVRHSYNTGSSSWGTAFSNNILRTGKHYVSFTVHSDRRSLFIGVMRPGKASQNESGYPFDTRFYQSFSRNMGHGEQNNENSIHCCMYNVCTGKCRSSDWRDSDEGIRGSKAYEVETWEGMEFMTSDDEMGMLLNLDEGTLSVYKNGRKLGVMKRRLSGQYCWVVLLYTGVQVAIKRGTISP